MYLFQVEAPVSSVTWMSCNVPISETTFWFLLELFHSLTYNAKHKIKSLKLNAPVSWMIVKNIRLTNTEESLKEAVHQNQYVTMCHSFVKNKVLPLCLCTVLVLIIYQLNCSIIFSLSGFGSDHSLGKIWDLSRESSERKNRYCGRDIFTIILICSSTFEIIWLFRLNLRFLQ